MNNFKIGDLVKFDAHHSLGVVVAVEDAEGFNLDEKVKDVKVAWSQGKSFWCLDCTLVLLSRD